MNQSERFWDKTASQYDQIEMKDNQTYLRILERTKTYLETSSIVLDFGCGTGLIANELAECVKSIHAVDTSSKMVEIAEQKAKERNIANIHYSHSTIFDQMYRKGSFDVILAFHVLHLLEDEQIVLQRINELLKAGGFLISATPCVGEKRFLKNFFYLAGRVGFVPNIRSFQLRNLVDTLENEQFEVVETDCLKKRSEEYFIVARKR